MGGPTPASTEFRLAVSHYRGTSLIRNRTRLGPYSRPMPGVLRGPMGVGVFLWARYPCTGSAFGGYRGNAGIGWSSRTRQSQWLGIGTRRRAAHPSRCARCGTGAGHPGIKYQSVCVREQEATPPPISTNPAIRVGGHKQIVIGPDSKASRRDLQ